MNRTAINRLLGASAAVSLALAAERLANAAMQQSATGTRISLTFGLVFGAMGVALVGGLFIIHYFQRR